MKALKWMSRKTRNCWCPKGRDGHVSRALKRTKKFPGAAWDWQVLNGFVGVSPVRADIQGQAWISGRKKVTNRNQAQQGGQGAI